MGRSQTSPRPASRALRLVSSVVLRWTAARPGLRAVLPFVPIVALWAGVSASGLFPPVFFPGPAEVVRVFASLVYKGILPEYLEDSALRLAVGALAGTGLGIPLGVLVGLSRRAHGVCWPVLLFFQAIGDIAWLPILLIWFGFGLTTMTFVIVYTVLFMPQPWLHVGSRGSTRESPIAIGCFCGGMDGSVCPIWRQSSGSRTTVAASWTSSRTKLDDSVEFGGLDGRNLLAFLAAMGTHVSLDRKAPGVRLSWDTKTFRPTIHLRLAQRAEPDGGTASSEERVVSLLEGVEGAGQRRQPLPLAE